MASVTSTTSMTSVRIAACTPSAHALLGYHPAELAAVPDCLSLMQLVSGAAAGDSGQVVSQRMTSRALLRLGGAAAAAQDAAPADAPIRLQLRHKAGSWRRFDATVVALPRGEVGGSELLLLVAHGVDGLLAARKERQRKTKVGQQLQLLQAEKKSQEEQARRLQAEAQLALAQLGSTEEKMRLVRAEARRSVPTAATAASRRASPLLPSPWTRASPRAAEPHRCAAGAFARPQGLGTAGQPRPRRSAYPSHARLAGFISFFAAHSIHWSRLRPRLARPPPHPFALSINRPW